MKVLRLRGRRGVPSIRYNVYLRGGTGDGDETDEVDLWLLASDFILTILWIWGSDLITVLAYKVFNGGEFQSWILYMILRYLLAWLGRLTGGGTFATLSILASAAFGDLSEFRFSVVFRVFAQVIGYAVGNKWMRREPPMLKAGILGGALTEGLLSFTMVIGYLGLRQNVPSVFGKIFISEILRMTLNNLGSGITGGLMSPTKFLGLTFSHGISLTRKQLIVYCVAPLFATGLAVFVFRKMTPKNRIKWD